MNQASDSKSPSEAQVSVENMTAGDSAVVAGRIETLIIQNVQRAQPSSRPRPPEPRHLPPDDPRVDLTLAALAHLHQPQRCCIYLGRRYGLTPHAAAPDLLDDLALGADPPETGSLGEAMDWLAGQIGMAAALHHLAERYSRLDEVDAGVAEELKNLANVVDGHLLATGSYSARIQNALGPALTVVHGDRQVERTLIPGRSKRSHLLMLHGSGQNFQSALVSADDVLTYSEQRPALTAMVSQLLTYPWIVLGADRSTDSTFHLLVRNVSRKLGMQQRPIFVVDPRLQKDVEAEWPRAALRHIGLTPAQFLSLARGEDDA